MLHVLVISLVEHPCNKIKSDYGCPKKRKDGMPKKHDPKKKERKRGSHVSKKRKVGMIRERKTITLGTKLHKSFVVVGKTEGIYCPGKEIQVECLERVILGTLPYFQKSFKKYLQMDCRSMSKYYSMHHSNSQQPKTRRQLKRHMKE